MPRVEAVEQTPARLKAAVGDIRDKVEIFHFEIGLHGIVVDDERGMFRAVEPGASGRHCVGNIDIRGDRAVGSQLARDN